MRKKTLNLGPFGIYLWGAILLLGGVAFAGGAALTVNTNGTIYTQQLANGTPTPGKFVRAGYCTDTATSTNTTDRQCWANVGEGDVTNLVNDLAGKEPKSSGTPGQAVCFSGTGTSIVTAKGACSFSTSTFTGGTLYAGNGLALSTGTSTTTTTASAADLASSPKVRLALPGTNNVVPKSDGAGGLADSSLSEPGNSMDVSKTFRFTGWLAAPASGYGVEIYYRTSGTVGGHILSYDRGASTYLPLRLTASSLTFAPSGTPTLIVPTTQGVTGQVLTLADNAGAATWSTPATNDHTVLPYVDGTPGYLSGVVASSDGTILLSPYGTGASAKLDFRANIGTGSGQICSATDSRLSNARTPTAHASTHVTGGGDVIANVVANGNSGLMNGTDKAALDGKTATPMANRMVVSDGSGTLDAWISAASGTVPGKMSSAHYTLLANASATPGASIIPKSDASGTLNGWVSGRYLGSTTYNDGYLTASPNGTWQSLVAHTFTATGTKFRVHATALYADAYSNARVCGLAIAADSGSSATTRQSTGWAVFQVVGAEAYNNIVAGSYFQGQIDVEAYFTLAAGTVTVGLQGYAPSGSYNCFIPSNLANIIIDQFN